MRFMLLEVKFRVWSISLLNMIGCWQLELQVRLKPLYDMCVENGLSTQISYDGMLQLKKSLFAPNQLKILQLQESRMIDVR